MPLRDKTYFPSLHREGKSARSTFEDFWKPLETAGRLRSGFNISILTFIFLNPIIHVPPTSGVKGRAQRPGNKSISVAAREKKKATGAMAPLDPGAMLE